MMESVPDSSAGVPTSTIMSVASSSARDSDILWKKHKRRGSGKGDKTKTSGPVQQRWNAGRNSQGSQCRYNHARPHDTWSDDEGSPSRRPRQTSGARTAEWVAFVGLTMVTQLGTAEATEIATAAAGVGCVVAVAVLLGAVSTIKRSNDAVGEIIDVTTEAGIALVNVTKEATGMVIEGTGHRDCRHARVSKCLCFLDARQSLLLEEETETGDAKGWEEPPLE